MSQESLYERYHRQMILPDFGLRTQQLLQTSKVLVLGAGGLGCPALQYLVGAGVGHIGIVDGDQVSLSNLHRQTLFTSDDIGQNKAEVAAKKLSRLNSDIHIEAISLHLTNHYALDVIKGYDIIVDGTDNFATRYMINDACVLLDKTLVYGAVSQYEGQVAVFNHLLPTGEHSANYRDIFPDPPKEGSVLNCVDAGVLGVLPGIIGAMQAAEVIKLITGIGEPLVNQLLTYQFNNHQIFTVKITPQSKTSSFIPADATAFKAIDYVWLCSSPQNTLEVNADEFDQLASQKNIDIVDVRELHELPVVHTFGHLRIPLLDLKESVGQLKNDTVVVFCQSGMRSLQAAKELSALWGDTKRVYSLQGGILSWIRFAEKK
ncbi:MAG: HesA/MoeB/ThiF family protein [Sediminibacterium sp.]|uniref:HesA/MoeB/ThiF family protein n=1 Tax=Sediminibacterium sp. TaxID=1917865 RepID=UPI002AB94F9F|nr:HesA/MoeB/ThiF family protein [Sediminibacterium sp.]MDZ4073079.1 HesA/MoeB/ThiF family protein [Sediminibacterium sp.]